MGGWVLEKLKAYKSLSKPLTTTGRSNQCYRLASFNVQIQSLQNLTRWPGRIEEFSLVELNIANRLPLLVITHNWLWVLNFWLSVQQLLYFTGSDHSLLEVRRIRQRIGYRYTAHNKSLGDTEIKLT